MFLSMYTSAPSESSLIEIAGSGLTFECEQGDTLLRAALRHGIGLSYECNAGSCGSCKIQLVNGELEDLYPDAPGIRPRDRDRGKCLACQNVPQGNCQIVARVSNAYLTRHAPARMAARLTSMRDITHDIREFCFQTDSPARFLAGQFAMIQLPGVSSPRAYSMSNVANEGGYWKFMVRRLSRGIASNVLFALEKGAKVEVDGPFGLAYLREDSERDIVCIAGGSGLAPMVSILDAAATHEVVRRRGAWLFYGGRAPRDVPAVSQFLCSHRLERGLEWHPVISVPELADCTNWQGEVGMVHDLLPKKLPLALANYEYYFAGPPPMIEATVRMLAVENKVPQAQLHFDRFF